MGSRSPLLPRRRLALCGRIIVSVALLGWIARGLDGRRVLDSFARLTPIPLLLGIGCVAAAHLASCVAMSGLLRHAQQGQPIPLGRLVRNHLTGLFWSLFLPSAVGGDIARVLDLRKDADEVGIPRVVAALATLRILALLSTLLLLMACLPLSGLLAPSATRWIMSGAGGAVVLGTAASFFLASGRWGMDRPVLAPARRWAFELLRTPPGRGRLRLALAAVVLSQSLLIATTALLSWSLGLPLPLPAAGTVVPLGSLAVLVPISINGIGVRESIYVECLGRAGIAPDKAFALSALLYVVNLVFAGIGGVLPLVSRRPEPPARRGEPESPSAHLHEVEYAVHP